MTAKFTPGEWEAIPLIAAAKELLAACERYVQDHQCSQKCDGPHPDCRCLFCEMSAAIRRATEDRPCS